MLALRADKRTKQVASKARELFPEVAAPDYVPKVKKKGKKVCFLYTQAHTRARAHTHTHTHKHARAQAHRGWYQRRRNAGLHWFRIQSYQTQSMEPTADQKCNTSVTIFSKLSVRVFCLYKQGQVFYLFVCCCFYNTTTLWPQLKTKT